MDMSWCHRVPITRDPAGARAGTHSRLWPTPSERLVRPKSTTQLEQHVTVAARRATESGPASAWSVSTAPGIERSRQALRRPIRSPPEPGEASTGAQVSAAPTLAGGPQGPRSATESGSGSPSRAHTCGRTTRARVAVRGAQARYSERRALALSRPDTFRGIETTATRWLPIVRIHGR